MNRQVAERVITLIKNSHPFRNAGAPRGRQWAVFKWSYLPNGSSAETVCYFQTKQQAMQMAVKLNDQAPRQKL